ncbi:MAG: NADH-quinone oxidoreductase subunit J [Micrococcales bacterium]|nr:NADH-quinone oxidoreductase subunit J [Micrococcales bacterium]
MNLAVTPAVSLTGSQLVLFWTVGPIMVISALGLLFAKRAVIAACAVMVTMVGMAFLYVGLEASFLGVVQVVVYTGAIMMLFVFVLMLVGVDLSDSFIETIRGQRWIALLLGLGLLGVLGGVAVRTAWRPAAGFAAANAQSGGNPRLLAWGLFQDHAFTLEVTGCLLIIAAVGAVVLTHRQRLSRPVGQAERAALAIKRGEQITPLPGSGVYARHNAADVPALDADGKVIEESVAAVVRIRGQVYHLEGISEDLQHQLPSTRRTLPPPVLQEEGGDQP